MTAAQYIQAARREVRRETRALDAQIAKLTPRIRKIAEGGDSEAAAVARRWLELTRGSRHV